MRKLWFKRKGVSTIIGGIIVLTLFLTALTIMVFTSQQYDSYQTTVEMMNQKDIQSFSENLVAVYPGIYRSASVTGGSCTPSCNTYDLMVSNQAGIGTEISRIYINSTFGGCTTLCVLDSASSPQPFHFLSSTGFVNPSEYGHLLIFYLNSTLTLPNVIGANTVAIVTSRGRVFSFQWSFPPVGIAAIPNIATSRMMIAYQQSGSGGYDSSKEGTGTTGYCHQESPTAISGTGVPGGSLYFVNPWVTQTIFNNVFPTTGSNSTTFFVYANITNTQPMPVSITGGNIVLQLVLQPTPAKVGVANLLLLGGPMIGIYYPAISGVGTFYTAGSGPAGGIPAGNSVIMIFKIATGNWESFATGYPYPPSDMTFSAIASVTNKLEADGSGGYFGATVVLDGLYVRTSC
jgi:hypothetical protein